MEMEKNLRYPELNAVLMVEDYIKKYDGEFKKKELWPNLSKKISYQKFGIIIDYLLYSKKISIDSLGKIGWIYYPENKNINLKNKNLFWKKNEITI